MSTFNFKHFSISQSETTMKVGTDAMLLGAIVEAKDPRSILDIGTGTGVIALMMAQRFSEAQVVGIEIDAVACDEASENFENSSWNNHLSALNEDVLEHEFNQQFDLIVSNPPYYENSLLSENDRVSRAKHAEFLPVNQLLRKVVTLLSEDGTFWVIVPFENTQSWIETSDSNGLFLIHSISIIGKEGQGEKRSVLAFSRNQAEPVYKKITVRNSNNHYTKEYIELTKEFHDRDLSN
ncbi:MAG: tRNA1(Val) (adenine(37)-N6)-methyltransferase [Crocinitomicaceae bacterium]